MDPARARLLRQLPQVDELLRHPHLSLAVASLPRSLAAAAVRRARQESLRVGNRPAGEPGRGPEGEAGHLLDPGPPEWGLSEPALSDPSEGRHEVIDLALPTGLGPRPGPGRPGERIDPDR